MPRLGAPQLSNMPHPQRVARILSPTLFGLGVAIALVILWLNVPPAGSGPTPVWEGPNVSTVMPPRTFAADGPDFPTNCTMLHVQFNATGPVELWVFPGGAANYSYPNLTISPFWAAAGPTAAGQFTVHVPSSQTGWQVAIFNPSFTASVPHAQLELSGTTC